MLPTHIDNMLGLITMAILADDQIHEIEIDVFTTVAQHLPKLTRSARPMSEVRLRAWYENNKIRLFKVKNGPDFNQWLSKSIEQITNLEDQLAVVLAMDAVSKSDNNYHVEEKSLLSFIAECWNIDLPLGKLAKAAI